jgi:aminoglycoside 2'-N-acetyltransferase I
LLFCEAHNVDFYAKFGWHPFDGKVLAQQPQGRLAFARLHARVLDLKLAPRLGVLDVCGCRSEAGLDWPPNRRGDVEC